MAVTDHTGRSTPSGWSAATARDEDGRPLEILLTADPVGGEEEARAVLGRPRVLRRPSGERVLSVTIVLTRAPKVGEPLEPLLDHAVLALDAETLPPADALAEIGATALVPQATTLTLVEAAGGRTLATVALTGAARAGGIQATLDRDDGAAVLAAVEGRASGLACRAELAYRTADASSRPARLRFDLAIVHDRLAAVADASRRFYRADLRHYLQRMLADGAVAAEPAAAVSPEVGEALLAAFLRGAAPVLARLGDAPDPSLGEIFELGRRPPSGTTVSTSARAASARPAAGESGRVAIEATLEQLLDDARAGGPLERCVSIVAPGGAGLEPIPLPPAGRRAGPPAAPALVADGERIATQWAALRSATVKAPAAHAVLASGATHLIAGRPELFAVADDVLPLAAPAERGGPLVDDPAAPIWPDRVDESKFFYAPAYALVTPDPAVATPAATPFLFRFRTVGHNEQGRPFLEATVRLTVERRMPDATRAEWEARGKPELQLVDADGLSLELRVPYRDESGTTRIQPIPAARVVARGEQVEAEFDLLDQWARVCYGALASPGFQSSPANVSVAYTFAAWRTARLPAFLGPAILRVPALERVRAAPGERIGVAGRIRFSGGVLELNSAANTKIRPGFDIPPIRPHVGRRPELEDIEPRRRFFRRTHGHSDQLDVLMPCATLGSLYVEEAEGELRPVGCQDSFQLGQAPRRVYAEVPVAAATNGTRVLRSLTSPGRFVIVPGHFRIGRYEPTEGARAYRPTMMLLSTIDVETPANTKCVFAAGLQPDLSVAERGAIERQLRRHHHPSPVVDLVTELPGPASVTWALPRSTTGWTVEDVSVRTEDGFALTLTTDTAGVQALQRIIAATGVHGSAAFELGDGQVIRSDVHLELDRIVGPQSTGPVPVAPAGAAVTLRNAIESPVAVSDLLLGENAAPVAVDATLAPGSTLDVTVPEGTATAVPVLQVQATPASLQEVRAYVEDITFEVRFVNLVDLAAHGLTGIDVTAHLAGDARDERAELRPGAPDDAVTFVSPLTQFATSRVIEFRVHRLGEGGAVVGSTEPVTWPLDSKGHLVSLTPELVLGAAGAQ